MGGLRKVKGSLAGHDFWAERVRSPWKGSWTEKGLVDGGSLWEAGKHRVVG